MHHIELLWHAFYISVDVRNLKAWTPDDNTSGQYKTILCIGWWLYKTIIPIECVSERLINIPRQNLRVDEVVKRRETALQEVKFRKRNQIHSNFVHINIEISLKPHRTRHIVDNVSDDRVLFFKMVLLFLMVPSLDDRCALLYLIGAALSPKWAFSLLEFLVLLVNSRDDVEQSLVVNWQNAVGIVD